MFKKYACIFECFMTIVELIQIKCKTVYVAIYFYPCPQLLKSALVFFRIDICYSLNFKISMYYRGNNRCV